MSYGDYTLKAETGRYYVNVHDVTTISSSSNAKFEEVAAEISKRIEKVAETVSDSDERKPSATLSGVGSLNVQYSDDMTTTGLSGAVKLSPAEVEAMIAKLAAGQKVQYNWRQSIVELMKLLNLDSSLNARKQLAQELGYKGSLDGSAEMNIWLHKQVMTKLAESGGKVAAAIRDGRLTQLRPALTRKAPDILKK
jgi:hypothetical protein